MLALQDELASAIAGEINVQLTPTEKSRLTAAPSVNPGGARCLSQGTVFLQPPERREPEEGDRAVRRNRQVESEFRTRVLRTVGRLSLGRLQRGVPDRQRGEAQGEGHRREGGPTRRQFRRSSHVARRLQAVLRIRLGGLRARIPPGDRAQSQLRLRARSVRSGTGASRDGSTKRSPRASAPSSWTPCHPRSGSTTRSR